MLYSAFSTSQWDDSERILCESLDSEPLSGRDPWWNLRMLAEVYCAKGEYDKAISRCKEAIQKTHTALGDDHVLFYMSVSLLSLIYESQGNIVEANEYRRGLPSGIDGSTPLQCC